MNKNKDSKACYAISYPKPNFEKMGMQLKQLSLQIENIRYCYLYNIRFNDNLNG